MKKGVLFLTSLLLISVFLSGCSQKINNDAEIFELPNDYELSFADEFDSSIDENIWYITPESTRKGGYWSPSQLQVNDGNLVITTEYLDKAENSGYYTGEMHWNNLRSTYGYYETRCKIEDVSGAWSAFWLMPDDISNKNQKAQDGCEIDIFESALSNRIQNTLHYDDYKAQKKNITKIDNLYDDYHTYGLDWKKDSLKFYFDNQLVWEVTDPDLISQYPVYMEVSTEVGGFSKEGKSPRPSRFFWLGNGIITDKNNALPSKFLVDYVRVYDNGELQWENK